MAIIAVAGGLGDLGRTIVGALKEIPDHHVYVLTRDTQTEPSPGSRYTTVHVDYNDQDKMSATLKRLNVGIIISVLNLHWPGASDAQINLIRAAATSGVVRGFVPSEFNIDYHSPEYLVPYPPRREFLRAEEELLRHPQLAFTLVRNGFFMDYLGLPYAETCLHHLFCILDLDATKAVIPGDGQQFVVFTHTLDVAKFLGALVSQPCSEWQREYAIIGERITLRDLVKTVENVTGQTFDITFEDIADLRNNVTTELPSNRLCYSYFPGGKDELNSIITTQMIPMAHGLFDISGTELHILFPHIQRIRFEQFIRDSWNRKVNCSKE